MITFCRMSPWKCLGMEMCIASWGPGEHTETGSGWVFVPNRHCLAKFSSFVPQRIELSSCLLEHFVFQEPLPSASCQAQTSGAQLWCFQAMLQLWSTCIRLLHGNRSSYCASAPSYGVHFSLGLELWPKSIKLLKHLKPCFRYLAANRTCWVGKTPMQMMEDLAQLQFETVFRSAEWWIHGETFLEFRFLSRLPDFCVVLDSTSNLFPWTIHGFPFHTTYCGPTLLIHICVIGMQALVWKVCGSQSA